jgi:glycosyltransferase involved in cell wall biosynthesis
VASVELLSADPSPQVRTFALTDLVQARAARRAAQRGIARHEPRAIVYCSITAALLWPRRGAISLDSLAAENRPGRHGVWQRPVERRRLAQAPLLLPWSEHALDPARRRQAPAIVVPVPIEGSAATGGPRDIAAVTYAADPQKRRLALVLDAWRRARRAQETLLVAGTDDIPRQEGVEPAGTLAPPEFRRLLARARAFVAAPRREDYGIAALEALAHGCLLVTTPSPGPYPALGIARQLDPRLVADDIAPALRVALDDPLSGYAERAAELLAPYRREAVDRRVAEELLPRLLH